MQWWQNYGVSVRIGKFSADNVDFRSPNRITDSRGGVETVNNYSWFDIWYNTHLWYLSSHSNNQATSSTICDPGRKPNIEVRCDKRWQLNFRSPNRITDSRGDLETCNWAVNCYLLLWPHVGAAIEQRFLLHCATSLTICDPGAKLNIEARWL